MVRERGEYFFSDALGRLSGLLYPCVIHFLISRLVAQEEAYWKRLIILYWIYDGLTSDWDENNEYLVVRQNIK